MIIVASFSYGGLVYSVIAEIQQGLDSEVCLLAEKGYGSQGRTIDEAL